MIQPDSVYVWLHTWWGRDGASAAAINSVMASDASPYVKIKRQPKGTHRMEFFLSLLKWVIDRKSQYKYIMRFEDDVEVSPYVLEGALSWDVLTRRDFGMGFVSTCDRVLNRPRAIRGDPKTGTLRFDGYGCHFGGGWIASTAKVESCLPRITAIMRYIESLGRFGPTTSIADAMFDAGHKLYIHLPALVRVDVSLPSHQLGDVRDRYGEQPYDPTWRRTCPTRTP